MSSSFLTYKLVWIKQVEHLRHTIFCLDNKEVESKSKVPRFVNASAFKHLISHVTLFAINQVKVEWEEAKNIRVILPCRHRLATICLPFLLDPILILINLLHPR